MDTDIKELLAGAHPIGRPERHLISDRIHQLERDIAAIQHEACVAARDRDALRALIANDLHALTFQSLAQYRASLSKFAKLGAAINDKSHGN